MARIEDYALLGDLQTAALVSTTGSIDWLCLPKFDSPACFAALLDTPEAGHWKLAPAAGGTCTSRHYVEDTVVLETEWVTPEGTVRVIDFMPPRGHAPDVVRIVEGVHGAVPMHSQLTLRFDYGAVVPWVRHHGDRVEAIAGPDQVRLVTPAPTKGHEMHTISDFTVRAGDRVPFVLTWNPSHERPPAPVNAEHALRDTLIFWREWSRLGHPVRGPRRHFTHSKVMAWVAADRMAAAVRSHPELDGPADRWEALGDTIRADVLARGYDAQRNTFTQSYGAPGLDAALLMIPRVGFLPPDDPRVLGTVAAVQDELSDGGFLRRYDTGSSDDGLSGGEGLFLACSFWLVDALLLTGQRAKATALFERLLALRNDVGLLSEEWDPHTGRQLGNTPQAFSHFPLVTSALQLHVGRGHHSHQPILTEAG